MTRTVRTTGTPRKMRTIVAAAAFALVAGLGQTASAASASASDAVVRTASSASVDQGRSAARVLTVRSERRHYNRRHGYGKHRFKRALDRRDVVRVLHRHGYRDIHRLRRSGRVYQARAVTRRGHPMRVTVSARNGRVISAQRLRWHRPAYRW